MMSGFAGGGRGNHIPDDYDEIKEMSHVSSVEAVLSAIPADIISQRAVHCRSFARALFHWEQHIRQTLDKAAFRRENVEMDEHFRHLQEIYAQIEEPDAVEGMSTRLQILDPEQQILEHKRAGRWTAAQSWYELSLADKPDDRSLQLELLTCLKASNRYGMPTENGINIKCTNSLGSIAFGHCTKFNGRASCLSSTGPAIRR
jgi:serine/threonine-protein kinase ATR